MGKVVIQDFHFVAHTAKQTPKLLLFCASGQHIKTATLTCRKAGGETGAAVDFLKIRLTDALVSSFQIGGTQLGGDPAPRDQFALHFLKIELTEISPSPTGNTAASDFGGFDFGANQALSAPTT